MVNDRAKDKIKICLVAISYGKGGAERSTSLLSQMLTDVGFAVTNVILTDRIDYEFSGELFNLGKDKKQPDLPYKRLQRFKKLREFFKREKFDLIIDNRPKNAWPRELFYLNYIYRQQKTVYVVRNFDLDNYLTDKDWMARKMIDACVGLVGVSKEISATLNEKYQTDKFKSIYNPVEELPIIKPDISLPENEYILFLGRLNSRLKNIPLLLEAYSLSGLKEKNIPLLMMGDGNPEQWTEKIKELNLETSVRFLPYDNQVGYYLKNAKFLALSSRLEGFPRVLIESLSVGTPVVSVDCSSGPKEVVQHEYNGLLVPNYQPDLLAKAMVRMTEDEELHKTCKANAQKSIAHLKKPVIANQWKNYINELLETH
ncbi:MAG TPA: glycosyltransferase [Flavobacteriaceae bacterium]|nr:glycosyltransferase [Flavobacteriaceae bacterium]